MNHSEGNASMSLRRSARIREQNVRNGAPTYVPPVSRIIRIRRPRVTIETPDNVGVLDEAADDQPVQITNNGLIQLPPIGSVQGLDNGPGPHSNANPSENRKGDSSEESSPLTSSGTPTGSSPLLSHDTPESLDDAYIDPQLLVKRDHSSLEDNGDNEADTHEAKRPRVEPPHDHTESAEKLIWSEKRGGICEALPYFKSYKSSMYASKKILKGFLIDEGIEMRDFFSAQVIITTLGGGRKLDPETQKMIRVADAADRGAPLESINAAWRNGLLVGMLAGSSNPLFMERCVPPHTYNVLDWFHITYIWKERVYTPEGRLLALWKMRFEKADLRKPSWWDRNGYHATATPETREAPLAGCLTCKKTSKTIYADGWTCLNNRCSQYYASLENLGFDNLRYSEEFLKERTAFSGELPPLMPDLAARLSSDNHGTNLDARRGFVCPDCGCCSRRLYWSKLVCENSDCGRSWITPIHEYPRELLDRDERKFNQRMARSLQGQGWDTAVEKVVNRRVIKEPTDFTFGSYQARAYKLPDADGNIIGTFTLFRSNSEINKAAGGPDSMFRELGMADIGLKRNVSAAPGSKVEGLCRHFSQNFGARYKFGVAVQSKGFDEAPPTILRALHRLIWASEGAVSMTPQLLTGENPSEHTPPLAMEHSFNELLALGYMERDQINFHDDGESELGPTVAAISLGSPSIMKFRPKSKLDFTRLGAKRTGREEEENGSRDYKSVLEVAFRHGDIMVMHGAHIHRLYEHDVEPLGDRRFSLTSRYIDPSKMEHQADRDDAAIKGRIPEESFIYSYNGE